MVFGEFFIRNPMGLLSSPENNSTSTWSYKQMKKIMLDLKKFAAEKMKFINVYFTSLYAYILPPILYVHCILHLT